MKKFLLIFAAAMSCTLSWGEGRSAQQMLQIAQQQLGKKVTETTLASRAKGASGATDAVAYSTYNAQDGKGFVIVGADDRLPEVLAYSVSGSLDTNNMPPALRVLLQNIDNVLPDIQNAYKATNDVYTPVKPLISFQWNQLQPFNNKCPVANPGTESEKHCLTGCVATGLAQVIGYWGKQGKFPAGSGTLSWVSDYKGDQFNVTYDFSTTIDWGNLIDYYSDVSGVGDDFTKEQADAVAELMAMCGALAKMSYSPVFSGAQPTCLDRVEKYFGFAKGSRVINHWNYTNDEWKDILYAQLQKGYPIIYGGTNNDASNGHCFVLDGMDERGYVHVNWGWSGINDAFFNLDFMNPESQAAGGSSSSAPYNMFNMAIVDFAPEETTPVSEYYARSLDFDVQGQSFIFSGFANSSHARQNAKIAVVATPMSGSEKADTLYIDSETTKKLVPQKTWDSPTDYVAGDTLATLNFREVVDGTYKLQAMTQDSGQEGWSLVRTPMNEKQYVFVTVEGGKVTSKYYDDKDVNLKVEFQSITTNKPRVGRQAVFKAMVHNAGRAVEDTRCFLVLQKNDEMSRTAAETVKAVDGTAPSMSVTLDENADTTFNLTYKLPTEAGTYNAFFVAKKPNEECIAISDTVKFEVEALLFSSIKTDAPTESNGTFTLDRPADFSFEGVSNVTADSLMLLRRLIAYDKASGFQTVYQDTVYFKATEGETITKTLSIPCEKLTAGNYTYQVYYGFLKPLDYDCISFDNMNFVEPTGIEEVRESSKRLNISKYIEHGNIVIKKNGKKYNGVGQKLCL